MLVAICLLALLLPAPAQAQDENRAGLVIVHGDGRVVQQCVAFAEESISGYELLQRAGGELNVEAGAMGATVCSIGGEGCSYPAESCFCRCQGSPCVYWSYWRLQEDGGWRYQPLGAANTRVQNGDVEAWRWAAGTTREAPEPPPAAFTDLCVPAAQGASAADGVGQLASETPTAPPATAAISASAPVTGPVTGPVTAVQRGGSVTGTAAAQPGAPGEADEQVGMFGGLALVLAAVVILPAAALLMWALVRRKR